MVTLLGIAEMSDLLSARTVSATEIVEAHLERAAGPGAVLGAIVDSDPERSLAEAAAVDSARAAGRPLGPLAGVPITIKDSFDVAGLRASHGRLSDARASTVDAPAVRRLRAAGAIVVGKTNVPVYLNDHQSSNDDFGITRNPFALDRSPGGSSGGASAAVAAGLGATDLGSDLAGSLRVPAAWCGLYGHRPSNGIISKLGHMPWPDGGMLEPMVSAVGPLARRAADLEMLVDILVGVEGPESTAWSISLPPPRVDRLDRCRIGVWLDDPECLVDSETRRAIEGFADALGAAGASVVEVGSPTPGPEWMPVFRRMQLGEVVHGLDAERWRDVQRAAADRSDVEALALTQTLRVALDDLEAQRRATVRWGRLFDTVDVVVCPAAPCAATVLSDLPVAERRFELDGIAVPIAQINAWSQLSSVGRIPATVVPLGPGGTSGLPIGAQLLGPYLEDRTPMRIAALAEAAGIIGFREPDIAGARAAVRAVEGADPLPGAHGGETQP